MSNTSESIRLTQQDFVSTFPWGLQDDEVRITQQVTENAILDAESAAAMAVLLGADSFSDRLDEVWKTYLNSQNHDIHVCQQEEVGSAWCKEALAEAEKIREEAALYIAQKTGCPVELNFLSEDRVNEEGTCIPAFGAVPAPKKKEKQTAAWDGRYSGKTYRAELAPDGTFVMEIGPEGKKAYFGNLTVEIGGVSYDSKDVPPEVLELVKDGENAAAVLRGTLGQDEEIVYTHRITLTPESVNYETELDYGDGCHFGPDIRDLEESPRRTHYFQHEKKLCMNFGLEEKNATFLYSSPFMTWPADAKNGSLDSLHLVSLQQDGYGLAHFNMGQGGYYHDNKNSSARHALSFAPNDYIYGRKSKLELSGVLGKHYFSFFPYEGDFREAELPLRANAYRRPLYTPCGGDASGNGFAGGTLISLRAESTTATALFENKGQVYLRLFEWAGRKDTVSLKLSGDTVLTECRHNLREIGPLGESFEMRPWEIKTVRISGTAAFMEKEPAKKAEFSGIPEGWDQVNQFHAHGANVRTDRRKGGVLYFATGYHDGFVRPMERHSLTMGIEMERTRVYENYSNYWEIGGSCWVRLAVNEPEYLEYLKHFVKDGKLEIVGGTWCEPFSLIVSGESNIRQMYYGMQAIKEAMDYDVRIYANQEHATYAQMPQILRSFGLYAAVNRTQWAPYGYESAYDADVANWVGPDGTELWMIPRYHWMDYDSCSYSEVDGLQNRSVSGHYRGWRSSEKFEEFLRKSLDHGIENPLMTMLEDIWDESLRTTDDEIRLYDRVPFVKFISLKQYLELYGIFPAE